MHQLNNSLPKMQDSKEGKESGNLYTPLIGTTQYSANPAIEYIAIGSPGVPSCLGVNNLI